MALFSRRDKESYLEIDHRDSPGLPDDVAARFLGMSSRAGTLTKSAAVHCSNCQRMIVLNPLRSRERFLCPKCDDYHCDDCALRFKLTGVCKTMRQVEDEFAAAAAKGRPWR